MRTIYAVASTLLLSVAVNGGSFSRSSSNVGWLRNQESSLSTDAVLSIRGGAGWNSTRPLISFFS